MNDVGQGVGWQTRDARERPLEAKSITPPLQSSEFHCILSEWPLSSLTNREPPSSHLTDQPRPGEAGSRHLKRHFGTINELNYSCLQFAGESHSAIYVQDKIMRGGGTILTNAFTDLFKTTGQKL